MRYTFINPSATIQDASAVMRECEADALLVKGSVDDHAAAVVWASDIVTLIIALGLDPRVLTVSDLLGVKSPS